MPELDRDLFSKRLKRLYTNWQNSKNESESMDAICVATGTDGESSYYKTTAMQQWLFGVEITDTAILFLDKLVVFIASAKKIAFFKQVENGKENDHLPKFKFIVREKNDTDKAFLNEAIELIKKSHQGKKLGSFPKEKFEGDFLKDWNKSMSQAGFDVVDASTLVATVLAVKDESELNCIKKAAEITNRIFAKYLRDQIINIVDNEKKVKHIKLSEGVEQTIKDSKYVPTNEKDLVEICYPAIIQSGGNYNLKFSATSDKNNLHFGTIVCALGFRYKNYCSNIVRTLMVQPTEKMQENYKYLLTLEEELISSLREGVKLNDLFEKIKNKCQTEREDLADKLTPNLGFIIGIEFREGTYLITNKCTQEVKAGMVFQISVGFSDLINADAKEDASKKYALFIGDTVQVNKDEPAAVLTTSKKKMEFVGLFIKNDDDQDEEDEKKSAPKPADILTKSTRGAVIQNKTRSDNTQEHNRKEHQKELTRRLNEEARDRILNHKGEVTKEKVRKAVTAYKSQSNMPYKQSEIQELKIFVDKNHETILLPIFGYPTPFHISTLKNLSSSVEGDFTYLRLNFFHPGATVNKAGATVSDASTFPHQDCVYIKEITYRATNVKEAGEISAPSTNLGLAFKYIKDMQKEYKEKEHAEKEKEGMVKQDSLILSNNKTNPKLKDLYMRPTTTQKRTPGTLEAHTNGFLYTSIRGEKIEILFNNIKHAIFQPCDHEIIILLHFHLKNPIMFGKKKHTDFQFYTEVGEVITDLGKHNRGGDRDDLIAEQSEREMRKRLNQAFKSFIEKVESMTNNNISISFEKPFKDLAFHGTPYRSMVQLQPTTSCLINVTEQPPFVLTLDQIELVHFERVSFSLKNFDMVFIFKDYSKKVVMITSIPMKQLDQIKEWLNSCDIKYTEGLQSFNWPKIMKTIVDDPEGFFDQGGWTFLEPESDSESKDADDDISDEEDDAYEPTESESEEDSDDDASDYSEEDDDDSDSDSGSGSGSGSDESGKDWSELEEEARKEDMENSGDESDHDTKKRKKPIVNIGGKTNGNAAKKPRK